MLEHLALSGAAIGLSILVAIPLGVWLGHIHRSSFLAITVANIGRSLPSSAARGGRAAHRPRPRGRPLRPSRRRKEQDG